MSRRQTQFDALQSWWIMRVSNHTPETIISVGVGSCPEYDVWQELSVTSSIVGIDPRPRPRRWKDDYIRCAVGESNGTAIYCQTCRSTVCRDKSSYHRHRRRKVLQTVKTATLDTIAKAYNGPLFLWIDVDGYELNVLRGAAETLRRTSYIHIEMIPPGLYPGSIWDGPITRRVHRFLRQSGFRLVHHYPISHDSLYKRVR